jgi:hypothetical protein
VNRISLSIKNIFGYIGLAGRVFSFRQTAASLWDNRISINIGLFYVNFGVCILGFGVDAQLCFLQDGEIVNVNVEAKVPAAYLSVFMAVNTPRGMRQYRQRTAWLKQRDAEDALWEARRAKSAATRAKNAAARAARAKVVTKNKKVVSGKRK